MTFKELLEALDGLCWGARAYGHDDYGLDGEGVDAKGRRYDYDTAEDPDEGPYHPPAFNLAVKLADHFEVER